MERRSQEIASNYLKEETQQSTSLNSRKSLIERLKRGADVRARFVDSNVSKALAFQTRSLREKKGWSQQTLAEKIGSNQNAIYRAENPNYGKQTTTTLKKIASAFDVALVVRFVPFSELIDWVSGTPRMIEGLNTSALVVADFSMEEEAGTFADPVVDISVGRGAANSAQTHLRTPGESEESYDPFDRRERCTAQDATRLPPMNFPGGNFGAARRIGG